MRNKNISVISVCFNNGEGLRKTLQSISECFTKPEVVIIIDGGSTDETSIIVESYREKIAIEFISEADGGIYDAMNKGLARLKTKLVHYLNAGDTISGDPYVGIDGPCILPVYMNDEIYCMGWYDHIKLCGYGYCHQGIIFPSSHVRYDIDYDLAADFKLICQNFPKGLQYLPRVKMGFVSYALGGVSSIRSREGIKQILSIARNNLKISSFIKIYIAFKIREMAPRLIRRVFFALIYRKKY